MKKVPVLIFILFLCIQGYSQVERAADASATIIGVENMVKIGLTKIKNDTILAIPDPSKIYYDLVIDGVHIPDFQNKLTLNQLYFEINRRKTILINCN